MFYHVMCVRMLAMPHMTVYMYTCHDSTRMFVCVCLLVVCHVHSPPCVFSHCIAVPTVMSLSVLAWSWHAMRGYSVLCVLSTCACMCMCVMCISCCVYVCMHVCNILNWHVVITRLTVACVLREHMWRGTPPIGAVNPWTHIVCMHVCMSRMHVHACVVLRMHLSHAGSTAVLPSLVFPTAHAHLGEL
jgi:hypothetical protein